MISKTHKCPTAMRKTAKRKSMRLQKCHFSSSFPYVHCVPQHNSLSHLSIPSLSPQGTYGTSRDVPWCPSTQCCIPYVHPSTSSQRDVQNVMGCPMESPTQLSVPPAHPLSPLHTTVFHWHNPPLVPNSSNINGQLCSSTQHTISSCGIRYSAWNECNRW